MKDLLRLQEPVVLWRFVQLPCTFKMMGTLRAYNTPINKGEDNDGKLLGKKLEALCFSKYF